MSGSQQTRKGFVSTLRRIICRLVCDDEPAPLPPKVRPIAFEPGKVVILTEFPPGLELTPREIAGRVSARLAKLQLDPRLEVNLAPERVIVLRSAQRTLASVTGDVPAARQSPRQLIRFISQLHRAIALPPLIPPPEPGPDLPKGDPTQQGAPADQSQPPTGDNQAPSAGLAAEARASQAPAMLAAATPTRHSRRRRIRSPCGIAKLAVQRSSLYRRRRTGRMASERAVGDTEPSRPAAVGLYHPDRFPAAELRRACRSRNSRYGAELCGSAERPRHLGWG